MAKISQRDERVRRLKRVKVLISYRFTRTGLAEKSVKEKRTNQGDRKRTQMCEFMKANGGERQGLVERVEYHKQFTEGEAQEQS